MNFKKIFADELFKDEVVLVTGGGTGIGKVIADEFGKLGASLAICSRKEENFKKAQEEFQKKGYRCFAERCDIRDYEKVEEFVDLVLKEYGRIDILVNNAGGQFPSPVENMSPRGWSAVINNNLNGTFNVIHTVGKKSMIPRKKGVVVNIVANMWNGFPGLAHTGAARAGVVNLTMTLAIEWAQYKIRINSVAPGTIATSGMKVYPKEAVEMARQWIPLKRYGLAWDVAQAVIFLASPAGQFVTGETIRVDGGESIYGTRWIIPDDEESKKFSKEILEEVLKEDK